MNGVWVGFLFLSSSLVGVLFNSRYMSCNILIKSSCDKYFLTRILASLKAFVQFPKSFLTVLFEGVNGSLSKSLIPGILPNYSYLNFNHLIASSFVHFL